MARISPSATTGIDDGPSYWTASRKPLQILAFLAPLIIAYELGLAMFLRSREGVLTNKAHETLLLFFDTFGLTATGGLYLGGAAIIVVLIIWHLLARDPWRIDPATPALMAAESLGLTIPLLVLGLVIGGSTAAAALPATAGSATPDLAHMSIGARLAISIGAGLYEELLFRMMLIAVLHTLLVDVGKIPSPVGAAIAVVVAAAAFTGYHPLRGESGALSWRRVGFYFLAGLYFGVVYVVRGFGIVVGTHAFYDVLVVSMLTDTGDGS